MAPDPLLLGDKNLATLLAYSPQGGFMGLQVTAASEK